MAYQNPWDEAQPQGTAAANTIDDIIRQLKVDIRERMESVVVDWGADPVVPTLGDKVLIYGYEEIRPMGSSALWNHQPGYTNLNTLGFIALPVRYRWTITKVEVMVNKNANASLSCTLDERLFNTSQLGAGQYGPIVVSSTGTQTVTIYSSAGGFMVSEQSGWTITITPPSAAQWNFYGARVYYTEG